ncbi:hypothetical protein ABFS82_13G146500 [Erythranthe guttata]|uniref:GIR1-like zinc ribbon domain-containing protein n=1 Tax=Erythranthe guttata TaxID=4155 RepID=A0A022QM59_ERYGU|nr:PREDICTED: uncharacterized protein LOC105969207 [Erythranthe guttata]EYU27560.1 hypothetical protein MIMGU_mgv1a012732mg [Erythranthe guttata]|eukprot:XP_012849412.1 PREDICTED: uncharacterized protein LOC105969207 [Erythranthe guttata]
MAADVSCLVRLMNGGDAKESSSPGKSTAPMTRDLLAGYCTLDSKELDLDLQVPSGWEKRLDLKSGKVYLQRCNSSSNSAEKNNNKAATAAKFQDLNFPPEPKQTLNLFDEASSRDLKLVSLLPTSNSPSYQSVCTLDKVKSALERAEKETVVRKRSISISSNKSSPLRSNNSTSSSVRDTDFERGSHEEEKSSSVGPFAAGCPSCLLYVLISKSNPKCPRCSCVVPFPVAAKKPRIDLNISI